MSKIQCFRFETKLTIKIEIYKFRLLNDVYISDKIKDIVFRLYYKYFYLCETL